MVPTNKWKNLKNCEIPEKDMCDMEVGDFFMYTGNITVNGVFEGYNKYIFTLKSNENGNIKFKSWNSPNTWVVEDTKKHFANVNNFVSRYGLSALKGLVPQHTYDKYVDGVTSATPPAPVISVPKAKKCVLEFQENDHQVEGSTSYSNHVADASIYVQRYLKQSNKEETKMSEKVKEVIEDNAYAAKVAAQMTAGATLNAAVMEKVIPQLPVLLRGYATTPIGTVVLANLVNFAVRNFMEDNYRAEWVANAMLVAAMSDVMGSFNLEKLLKEVISTAGVNIPENK